MAIFLQDLDQRFPIVDPETGKPTDYFLRLLRGQTGDLADGLTDVDAAISALQTDVATLEGRNIDTGFGLSGGGDLSADRTIALGDPALTDPGADRGLFWDDSAGELAWLTFGSGLTLTDTTLTASGGGGGGGSWKLLSQTGAEITATTVTITIASPGVVSWTGHGLTANTQIVFTTTGALPTGLTAGTVYFVRNPAANSFEVSATSGGASINTTGTQSGTHTAKRINSWDWSTNVTVVDFINLSGFSNLLVMCNAMTRSISGQPGMQFSVDNGSSFFAGASYELIANAGTTAATNIIGFTSVNALTAQSGAGQVFGSNIDGSFKTCYRPTRSADGATARFIGSVLPINALRITNNNAGNITAGTIQLFGM